MGNSLTSVSSNWFAVTDIDLAEHLVALDKDMMISVDRSNCKVKLGMNDAVNWDKYLNHTSIFELLAGLLIEGESIVVDEIAYMDGSVVYNEQLTFSSLPHSSTQSELIAQLLSDDWTVIVNTINSIQEQVSNLSQLCMILGIPLAYLNCLNYDMDTSERLRYFRRFNPAADGPFGEAVVAFLVHQCITLSCVGCGDIGRPALEGDDGALLLWAGEEDPCDSFTDGWDGMGELVKTIFLQAGSFSNAPRFLLELFSPSVWPIYEINMSGWGLTSIPQELLVLEDVEDTCIDLSDNALTDITNEELDGLLRFSEFYHDYFSGNPIPESRLIAINEYIQKKRGR